MFCTQPLFTFLLFQALKYDALTAQVVKSHDQRWKERVKLSFIPVLKMLKSTLSLAEVFVSQILYGEIISASSLDTEKLFTPGRPPNCT